MKVSDRGAALASSGEDIIMPDAAMLIRALRQIGYSFEQAISDLIDNSISAGASVVLLRFFVEGEKIRSIALVDNGSGMSEKGLTEAMRFGSETHVTRRTLGKFGMGMKLASLSYAQSLTVVTTHNNRPAARRWSVANIGAGWACTRISARDAAKVVNAPWGELSLSRPGTAVLWDDIDRLPTGEKGIRELLKQLQRRLQLHLGMTFHRFLEKQQGRRPAFRILIDLQFDGADERPHFVEVEPLNPFGYSASGHPDYPQNFTVSLGGRHRVEAVACIWPANAEDPTYKLGNRAAARQGFYFYRNNRLIQAGGWNALVQNDAEPHSSLARVRIDLPQSLDALFGLNVQKSAVIVPPIFLPALLVARSDKKQTFDEYRSTAQTVYRRHDARAERQQTLIPTKGLPKALSAYLQRTLPGKTGSRGVRFVWTDLDSPTSVFEIDRKNTTIRVSRRLRKSFPPGSGKELTLLRTCLFFLLQEDLLSQRVSSAQEKRLHVLNKAIAMTLFTRT
jgi:hypothetical protein